MIPNIVETHKSRSMCHALPASLLQKYECNDAKHGDGKKRHL